MEVKVCRHGMAIFHGAARRERAFAIHDYLHDATSLSTRGYRVLGIAEYEIGRDVAYSNARERDRVARIQIDLQRALDHRALRLRARVRSLRQSVVV